MPRDAWSIGDLAAMAIGGDGAHCPQPCQLPPRIRWHGAELSGPYFVVGEGSSQDGSGTFLDKWRRAFRTWRTSSATLAACRMRPATNRRCLPARPRRVERMVARARWVWSERRCRRHPRTPDTDEPSKELAQIVVVGFRQRATRRRNPPQASKPLSSACQAVRPEAARRLCQRSRLGDLGR